MSFTMRVKEELVGMRVEGTGKRQAEISGLLKGGGSLDISKEGMALTWESDKALYVRHLYSLIKAEEDILIQVQTVKGGKVAAGRRYQLIAPPQKKLIPFLCRLEIIDETGNPVRGVPRQLTASATGRNHFLRGLFLTRGSINNPEKNYYLEILLDAERLAWEVSEIMAFAHLKVIRRKRRQYWVLSLNRVEDIHNFLINIGAHGALLDLESIRVIREMKGEVNRRVNWETANLDKTVKASMDQLDDIELLASRKGLKELPASLYEIARLRLKYPHLTLKELGMRAAPPLGKSGVNHRLRRIKQLAAKLRKDERGS